MVDVTEPSGARRLIDALTLSDHVRHYLLEGLTSGRLQPGCRINEADLARRLGISRNPVREAVAGLAQRGFLVAVPRRGHFMRRFTRQDVDDVFSFRICLEGFAIRQALPRMRRSDHAELARLVERMIAAAGAGRVADLHQADIALHRRVVELSGNRRTLRAHEGIDTEVQMLIAYVDPLHEPPMRSALAHVPVVEALAGGDADRAVAAMQAHLQTTWDDMRRLFARASHRAARGSSDAEAA